MPIPGVLSIVNWGADLGRSFLHSDQPIVARLGGAAVAAIHARSVVFDREHKFLGRGLESDFNCAGSGVLDGVADGFLSDPQKGLYSTVAGSGWGPGPSFSLSRTSLASVICLAACSIEGASPDDLFAAACATRRLIASPREGRFPRRR